MGIQPNQVIVWIETYANTLAENKSYLTDLDSAIGDGDHGVNMDRGFQAVSGKLTSTSEQDIGAIFKTTAMTLISTVGGASGPLYGTFFLQMGTTTNGKLELTMDDWISAVEAGIEGVIRRGKTNPGDKTMVDSMLPALEALKAASQAGQTLTIALEDAARAAQSGMHDTIPLIAKKGRASYLGERSVGHQDPGATSTYLLFKTAAETLA
jgi:dihydroxyacetone kinase-like protein